jgi:hypothetical protein
MLSWAENPRDLPSGVVTTGGWCVWNNLMNQKDRKMCGQSSDSAHAFASMANAPAFSSAFDIFREPKGL